MMLLFEDCVPFPHFVQTHGLVQSNFAVLTLAPPSSLVDSVYRPLLHYIFFLTFNFVDKQLLL